MEKINGIDYTFRFIDGSFWETGGEECSQEALWGKVRYTTPTNLVSAPEFFSKLPVHGRLRFY